MVTTVQIDMPHYRAHYFDDPGKVPGTPPTGYTLSSEVEQWLRDNGGCEGWRLVDVETPTGSCELLVEVEFSVDETATRFGQKFPRWQPSS